MIPARKIKRLALIASLIVAGCSNAADLSTPDTIGEKARLRMITGKQAARVVDRLHGRSVATNANVIAEYGNGENKDILYLSRYTESEAARKAFELMIDKMASAKKSPFVFRRFFPRRSDWTRFVRIPAGSSL